MCCGDRVCPAPPDLPSRLRGSSETAEKGVDNCCNRRRRFLQVQMVPALEAMGLDMLETVDPLQQQLAPCHHPLARSEEAGRCRDGLGKGHRVLGSQTHG